MEEPSLRLPARAASTSYVDEHASFLFFLTSVKVKQEGREEFLFPATPTTFEAFLSSTPLAETLPYLTSRRCIA